MRALLDVDVLIALLDAAHVHHHEARAWLEANIAEGWASCPITQNGCIRILSQPAYPGAQPPAVIAARLAEAVETRWHEFWADDLTVVEPGALGWQQILSSRQLTDAYLQALAVRRGGRLVTLDRAAPLAAVAGVSAQHLVIL